MPVAEVLRLCAVPRCGQPGICGERFVCLVRSLEDPHEAMEAYRQMCYPYGLDDGQDHRALHQVARRVPAVRLLRADVKIGQIARARPQRQRKSGKQRATS